MIDEDGWGLELEEITPEITSSLIKNLYKWSRKDRRMLENRIISDGYYINYIFDYMRKEPKITSEIERMELNPGVLYYNANNIPIPEDYQKNKNLIPAVFWETFN